MSPFSFASHRSVGTSWSINSKTWGCLTSPCLRGRRIGDLSNLQAEIGIWSDNTNAQHRGVDWQFKIDDARRKLKRLYPNIKP